MIDGMTSPSRVNDEVPDVPQPGPGTLYRVCFVCTGNICRSPMAAAVFRARVAEAGLTDRIAVGSAGTGDWHAGGGADHRASAVLTANGYADAHVARQFKPEWFGKLNLVIALDEGHARLLRRWASKRWDRRKVRLLRSYDPAAGDDDLDVPDPYYGDMDSFELCLSLIEPASEGLLAAIRAELQA